MKKIKLLLLFVSISFSIKSVNIYFAKPNFNNNDAFVPNYVAIAWEDNQKQSIPGPLGVKEKVQVPKKAKSFKLFFANYCTESIDIAEDRLYDPNEIFADIIKAANNSRKRSFLQVLASEVGPFLIFEGHQHTQEDQEYNR